MTARDPLIEAHAILQEAVENAYADVDWFDVAERALILIEQEMDRTKSEEKK